MTRSVWQQLNLTPATLARLHEMETRALEAPTRDERSPHSSVTPSVTIAFLDGEGTHETRLETVEDWRAQDPVSRIVNAILLSAMQESVEIVTLEPWAKGARVVFSLGGHQKNHIALPHLAAKPVAAHLQRLARVDEMPSSRNCGTIRLQINGRPLDLQLRSEPTEWGQRLELRFPLA